MKKQHLRLILTIFSYLFSLALARGPHHPRGAAIVKRHTHYTPGKKAVKLTEDTELLQDKEHIKEHLEEVAPQLDLSKMSEQELELYYFLLHDSDKNSKLDGLELLNAILHTTHDDTHKHDDEHEQNDINTHENDDNSVSEPANGYDENFQQFVELVDQVLKEDDKNQDGYLDYAEYVKGKKRTERVVDSKQKMD